MTLEVRARPIAAGVTLACALAAFAVAWWVYAPGFLSADSYDQLREARSGSFTDWHPPAFALLWRALDRLWPCQPAMLAAQLVAFIGGSAFVVRQLLPGRAGPIWHLLFCLAPPTFALVGTIWKDVHLAAFLFAGVALVVAGGQARTRALSTALGGAGAVALVYAIAVRHNGFSALLPLMPCLVVALRGPSGSPLRPTVLVGVSALAFVLAVGLATGGNAVLSRGSPPSRLLQYTAMFDLVGMSLREQTDLVSPALEPEPAPSLPTLAAAFDVSNCVPLFFVGAHPLHGVASREAYWHLIQVWLGTIASHPATYLRHRLANASHLLGAATHTDFVFQPAADQNELGCGFANPPQTNAVVGWHLRLKDSVVFRPWFWLLPSMVVLLRRARRAPWSLEVGLAASALAYVLPYLVLAQASDFRYTWWATVVGVLLVPSAVRQPARTP